MYNQFLKYSRKLQRKLSTASTDTANSSTNGDYNNDNNNSSLAKPLLPATVRDTTNNTVNGNPPSSPTSTGTAAPNHHAGDPTSAIPTHAYVTLATAVIALSSIGPSLDLQHGVAPILKIFWRMTGTWMTLSPIAIHSIYKDGWPKVGNPQILTFLCASVCYAVMCVAFVLSLEYTSVGNAVIFSNTHALLLLLGRFLVGSHVSLFEGGGALIAFVGGVFCTYDESLVTEDAPSELQPSAVAAEGSEEMAPIWVGCFGDLLATLSALGGCLYLVLASTIRSRFPSVYVFVFMLMITASTITLSCIVVLGQDYELSRDIHIGLWGFMNARYDRLPLEMFMVIVCNLIGSMGYLRSTKYFDNLVISVATLMEPVVASSLAYLMGVGLLPGFLGCVGNLFVAMGTVLVINPVATKKESCVQ